MWGLLKWQQQFLAYDVDEEEEEEEEEEQEEEEEEEEEWETIVFFNIQI